MSRYALTNISATHQAMSVAKLAKDSVIKTTPLLVTTLSRSRIASLSIFSLYYTNYEKMAVFDWAISWSTLTAWSTFRIRLVLHVIPWSTKDVRRNACDIFRS